MEAVPVTAEQVQAFCALLADGALPEGAEGQIDLIASLEDLKSAACAVQADAAVAYDAKRRSAQAAAGVPAARQGRGVAAEIGLARRESPHRGQVLLGLAKVLRTEMPHTLARLRDGSLSEFRATLLARETACLVVEHRMFVDEEICADPAGLEGVGTRELIGRVKRMVAELDPAAVVRRARRAEADRNVTVRPAPDTMAYLSGLMPVAQAVSAYASLRKDAEAARAAGDPRSLGQLMSDLLLARLTGVADTGTPKTAPAVPVTVNVVVSDESMAGGHGPAEVSADGVAGEVIPAEVARNLIAGVADSDVIAWFRCLYRNRLGRLVSMSSKQRLHSRAMAEFLAARGGGICATPFCDAPIRHNDHIHPADQGGETSTDNGQGLCEACNHAKQAPGWQQHVVSDRQERHQVETITPTGHRYTSTAPAPPGWREPRYVQIGPGRYGLVA
ncbi:MULTISPECIES: HNH endonuclease [unclassified Nocardioides]|uniref:HNH endonuclease n=1 Tax=unclassified Nocardioides TaxID=2615069 RepID=UPI0006F704DF|nr:MULTISPECIES: HNH endonuclease [unclassified Nocardioides]KRA27236.1 hypothetical protein ASD81_24410 [Nocardioides sp. Root614]KRA91112.1 hypothetical protein ASD84_00110 [Nocardioides sp. Root682]